MKMPEPIAIQHFSHAGITPELKEKFEQILGGTVKKSYPQPSATVEAEVFDTEVASDVSSRPAGNAPPTQTFSVEDAIARLAQEAQRGWFYKKRIEKKLTEAGALPKWKRPRRK